MSKKIIVICSSPRNDSNSDALADAFIEGALEAGNTITRIKLSEQNIKPCMGCDHCRSHHFECIQKDDMQKIYQLLRETDIIVFATPLYFLTFSSQLKILIDRLYCLHHGKLIQDKESILLVSSGSSNPAACESLISTYKAICKLLKWKVIGHLTAGGYAHDNSIKNSEKLSEARVLGCSIAG